ncbi:KRAB [Mytilus coruscus]|uniref:KRAB n=1 Tax=Mytilus coruscus TaxID=42192 RepID=A0A6J8EG42_MYTCO|nr:KRAB [Mytilus coruscus]
MDFRRVTGPFIHNSTINEEQTINHDGNKSKDEQGEHANSNEASFLEIAERLLGKSEMVSLRQVNEELKSTEIACDIESENINTMKGEIIDILPGTTAENKNTFQYRLNGIDLQKTGESSDTCNRNDQFIDNIMNVNQSFEDENSMTENTEQNKLHVVESEKPDTNYSEYTEENIKSNNQDRNHHDSLGDHLTKILNPSYSHDSDSDSIEEELEQNRKQSVDNDIKKSVQENVAIKFDKGSQTFMYLSSSNQSNPKDMGSISKKFVPQTETCISDRELPYKFIRYFPVVMEVDVESTERHFESNDNNHQMFIHENAKLLYNFKTDLDNDKALTTMDKTNRMKEVFNQYKEVNNKGKQDEEKILSGRIKRDALRNPLEVESTKLSQDVPSMLSSIDKLALKLAANKKQHIKSNIKCSSSSNRYGGEIIGESPIETLENFSKVDSADHVDNIHMAQETCDMSKIIKEIYEKSLMRDKLLFDKHGKASIYSPVDIISSTKSASDNLTGTLNRDHIPSDTLDHNCPSYKTELNINSYMCEMKSEPLEAIVSKEYQIDKDQEPLNESVCPEKSLDDKYDYFSRNIEIFVTHGPPKIKPRKKKTIQLPVDPQTVSDSVDDLIHTGDKPYKCGICGKGFAQSHDRKKHERVHTGERPYVCPLCGKDFSDNSQLWKHARTHDEDQEEGTLFKCRSCDKEYEYSSQLIHHMKEHSREQAGSIQLPNIGNFDNDSEMEKVRLTAEALVKDTLDIRDSSVNTEQNQVIADDKYLNVINGKDGNEYKNAFENLPGNFSENEESEPDQKEDGNESWEPKWNGKMYIAENAPENG